MKLIKLTNTDGSDNYLNTHYIVGIVPLRMSGCRINFVDGDSSEVREDIYMILSLLNEE